MEKVNYFETKLESTFSPMDFMSVRKKNPKDYVLVDVRNGPVNLRKAKAIGAIEMPLSTLENNFSKLPKDKIIVLYCWDVWCNTAAKAAVFLQNKGYSNIKELAGGIAAWNTMNLPIEDLSGVN